MKKTLVSPADLKPGQQIVGIAHLDGDNEWTTSGPRGNPVKVNTVEPCPSRRRTHVHVNRLGCYDSRIPVEVA